MACATRARRRRPPGRGPRLIGRLGEMQGDVPAPSRPLERRDRGLALEKALGQHIDDAPGGLFVADGKAGAVGGGEVIGIRGIAGTGGLGDSTGFSDLCTVPRRYVTV